MRTLLILTLAASLGGCSAVQSNPTQAAAKTMKNPVAATPQSIANGKRLFDRFCANCHGAAGNGVSEMA